MLRIHTSVALPIIVVMLVAGFLLATSSPAFSQPASAAPNIQATVNIPTQMVPNNWPLIPSGLGEGDTFRLIFLSTGTSTGLSNAVSDYNSIVQTDALKNTEFKQTMGLLFRALVSVHEGIDARGNTLTRHLTSPPDPGHNSPIYWVRGEKVADNYADFYDGSWDSKKLKDYRGETIPTTIHTGGYALTGSKSDGTHATTDTGWSVALGSPQAWWSFGMRFVAYGRAVEYGNEIYHGWGEAKETSTPWPVYGVSPPIKVRSDTGAKPVISGPTGKVNSPFDVTISFPDDYQINGMELGDVQVSGGTASNLRGKNYTTGGTYGVTFTVTITPDKARTASDEDQVTVTVSMNEGAVSDQNGWGSVASDTYTVKSSYGGAVVAPVTFDSNGVGTVPSTWSLIPSAALNPGDSFRLLFVTSDGRNAGSTNIDDYNRFVQTAAARNIHLEKFSSRFRVLGSTAGVHAIDNTGTRGTGVPIYWVEGAKVADSYTDFYDASWDSRAGTDELGKLLNSQALISTGSKNDGTRHFAKLGGSNIAQTTVGGYSPLYGYLGLPSYETHFYALSPVLKVKEPGGL